jgi:hypothetical protein
VKRSVTRINPTSDAMNDLPSQDPDPVALWLSVSRSPDANVAALRKTVLQRTTRILRHRRWARRVAVAAALAACYAAGVASMYWLRAPARAEVIIVEKTAEPAPSPPATVPRKAEPSAVDLEWLAVESPDKRVEFYRRAGDRYLAESNDTEAALRCYRQMLNTGSEKDLLIAADDNWLLMALKDARLKEKLDAKSN